MAYKSKAATAAICCLLFASSCGGGNGGEIAAGIVTSFYDLLVSEQGSDFQYHYPDSDAYPDFAWELYREASRGTPLSWSGGMTGHELGKVESFSGRIKYQAINNVSGRVRITISGVAGQNTRVSFSEVTEIDGTAHDIPDLMFSLLPHLEAGHRRYFHFDGPDDDPPSAWIRISEFPDSAFYPDVEGDFWRHAGYSGKFEAERTGR